MGCRQMEQQVRGLHCKGSLHTGEERRQQEGRRGQVAKGASASSLKSQEVAPMVAAPDQLVQIREEQGQLGVEVQVMLLQQQQMAWRWMVQQTRLSTTKALSSRSKVLQGQQQKP